IDSSLFQCGIDVPACKLLRHHSKLLQCLAGPTPDAELEALEIIDCIDLLPEPTTHLRSGVAANKRVNVELFTKFIHQLQAVTVVVPGILLSRVDAERHCAKESPGWVLADEVVCSRVANLHVAILHRIEHLEAGYDLPRCKSLDLEFVVGRFGDVFCQGLTCAVKGIERLRPARRQTPPDLRH